MPSTGPLKRALVTGASGFIGRRLCDRLLREGVRVRAVMRRPTAGAWDEACRHELGKGRFPVSAMEDVDTVFHLAGKAHALSELAEDDETHDRVTVKGTRDLLAAADAAGVTRIVFFSSVKAMGEGGETCLDERAVCKPETAYGRAKLEAEKLVTNFGKRSARHVVNLRLPLVYGPGSKGNLDRMLEAVAARRFPPLPDTGNKRSMVHVDDVAELAILACAEPRASGQTYIVTDGRTYSTREIYDLMRSALGKRSVSWSVPTSVLRGLGKLGDLVGRLRGKRFVFDSDAWQKLSQSAWYSSAKAERELGFRPSRTLADALPEMVAELREAD